MKNTLMFKLLLFLLFINYSAKGQVFKLNNSKTTITINGTSTLHDWEEIAETVSGKLILASENSSDSIKSLNVNVVVESLKSGKQAMDKNTYKALKSDKHKNIIYRIVEVVSTERKNDNTHDVETNGELTISGVTKKINMNFTMVLENNEVNLKGEKPLKMTLFGIAPPKALMGTIKTGDDIIIKFNALFVKS